MKPLFRASIYITMLLLILAMTIANPTDNACTNVGAMDLNPANFKVTMVQPANSPFLWSAKEGVTFPVIVKVENTGQKGTAAIEVEITRKDSPAALGFWSEFLNIPDRIGNCVPSATNVETVLLTLNAGESGTYTARPRTPGFESGVSYQVQAVAFSECYNTCGIGDLGYNPTLMSFNTHTFQVLDTASNIGVTCNDNIKNQDETDTDCGGVCNKCQSGYQCDSNSDCSTNFCDGGLCKSSSSSGGGTTGDEPGSGTGIDPVTNLEICGDGADNNQNGEVDEGCKFNLKNLPWLWISIILGIVGVLFIWNKMR